MCCLYFPVSYLEKAYVKASFTTNTEDVRIQEEFFFLSRNVTFMEVQWSIVSKLQGAQVVELLLIASVVSNK